MKELAATLKKLVLVLVVIAIIVWVVTEYSFVFARTVEGRIVGVDRIIQPTAVITSGVTAPETMFSFAVAIEDEKTKKVYTASSEDRQWGVAQHCVRARAKFYPYPPWNLEKADTYYNARLLELMDCNKGAQAVPAPTEATAAAPAPETPAAK